MHRYIADHETTSITGAFLCCRKSTFLNLGGFKLAFPNSFQDVDFCLRARSQGMRCLISPHVRLLHFESVSRDPRVDNDTLVAIRDIHGSMIAPFDEYNLHPYEKPRVSLWSLTGLRYYLGRIKRALFFGGLFFATYSVPGPRHPPSVLKNKEWLVR